MAETRLFLGILMYLIFVSIVIGYCCNAIGIESGVPDYTQFGSGQMTTGTDTVSVLASMWSLIQTVGVLILWNVPESIFPLWANILFIKTALTALILIIVDVFLP